LFIFLILDRMKIFLFLSLGLVSVVPLVYISVPDRMQILLLLSLGLVFVVPLVYISDSRQDADPSVPATRPHFSCCCACSALLPLDHHQQGGGVELPHFRQADTRPLRKSLSLPNFYLAFT
jgi:hypothetical protein